MSRNWITVAALATSLLPATRLSGQDHAHETTTGHPRQVEPTGAVPLSGLLAASDQAVRAIEVAAQEGDPVALAEAAEDFASAMASVERYLEEAESTRIARDLPRLEKALARQRDRLQALADRSSTQPRAVLGEALDASDRALDATSAARDAGLPADSHHGTGQHRRGCGHH